MGIYPNVKTSKMEHVSKLPDFDAAVDEFREEYQITSLEQEEILRKYLATILSQARSRRFLVLLNEAKRTAHCRAATRLAQLGTLNSGIF